MKPASLAPAPEGLFLCPTLETVKNDSYPPWDVPPCIPSFDPDFSSEEPRLKKIKKLVQLVSSSIRTQIQDSPSRLALYSEEQDGPRLQV